MSIREFTYKVNSFHNILLLVIMSEGHNMCYLITIFARKMSILTNTFEKKHISLYNNGATTNALPRCYI